MKRVKLELNDQIERRFDSRKRVLRSGIIAYWDGARSFGCTIRNISDGGARISKPRAQPLPEDVYLICVRERTIHKARLVWSGDTEAGFMFRKSNQLNELTDPKYNYLRRLSDSAMH